MNSLPNYDGRRPLEGYLFSICAYKLTDHLRREGRRPVLPLAGGGDSSEPWEIAGSARKASSIARSGERIRHSIAPYTRFIRAEADKLQSAERDLGAALADISALRSRIESTE